MGIFKRPSEGGSRGRRGRGGGAAQSASGRPRPFEEREDAVDWTLLSGKRARRFEKEAIVEIGRDHDLAGLDVTAVRACPGCDDVLFRLSDSSLAIVHLTWSGHRERPPWPQTTRLGGFLAVDLVIAQHEH